MKNRKQMHLFSSILAVTAFLLLSSAAYGDLYWETEVAGGGIPKDTVKNCLSSNAFRTESVNGTTIVDYETATMYQLNVNEKTYIKIDLEDAAGGKMGELLKKMNDRMKVTPTDETKEIAGYKCRKYNAVNAMGVTEYWVSKGVEGYREFFRIMNGKMKKMAEKSPMLKQMNMGGLMNIDGFPVQTVINIMGVKSTITLKKIEKKSLSKDIFKVPEDYKLKKMPSFK